MFEKYITALELMDVVIAEAQKVQDVTSNQDRQATNIAWDTLYTFVLANFIEPKSAQGKWSIDNKYSFEDEVDEMVVMIGKDRATLEEELRKIPPVIAEVAFPVYIARYLLRDIRVPISPEVLPTFKVFAMRYGYMIIIGHDKRRK